MKNKNLTFKFVLVESFIILASVWLVFKILPPIIAGYLPFNIFYALLVNVLLFVFLLALLSIVWYLIYYSRK